MRIRLSDCIALTPTLRANISRLDLEEETDTETLLLGLLLLACPASFLIQAHLPRDGTDLCSGHLSINKQSRNAA